MSIDLRFSILTVFSVVCVLASACAAGTASPSAPQSAPAAGALAGTAAPAAAPARSTEPAKVTAGMPGSGISFLPLEFGQHIGIFREEGIELELNSMQPGIALAAIAADQVDYVLTVAEGMRAALAGVAPIRLVGGITNSVDWFLYGAGPVRNLADLRGKTIAVGGPKGETELAVRAVLGAAGLDPERDQIGFRTGTTTPDRLAQLQQGTLEAALIASPAQFRAEELGFQRLANIGEQVDLPIVAWATSERKIQTRPDEVKRVLRATVRSIAYIHAHQDEAAAYIQEKFRLTPEQARTSLELDLRLFARNGEIPEAGVRNWLKVLAEIGEIPSANIATSQFLDQTLIRQVQAELGVR
jgi:ABC-type nitrate/sulfonate/bicarbonate transport system substrate-binding protein